MTNADKFKHLFGIYATELWAMPESDFLEWLNADAQDMPTVKRRPGKWIKHQQGFWSFVNEKGERDGWTPSYECSECGSGGWRNPEVMNFCPVCGAKMEVNKESN